MSSRVAVLEPVADAEALRPADYLAANPDVRAAGMDALHHFLHFGSTEGRKQLAIGSVLPQSPREVIVNLASKAPSVLEIGPFCAPALRGDHIRYMDVLDRNELVERAKAHNLDPSGVSEIHYVSPTGDLSCVPDRFDAVFSSHNIEHQPDLVSHLLKVAELLRPGGSYFLLVPDKRYSFDHFIAESTVADVLEAFHQRRTTHTLASVVNHAAFTTHNDAVRHWSGDHGPELSASARVEGVLRGMRTFQTAAGAYIDVHAWQFTPDGFKGIIDSLRDLGLARYGCEILDTAPGTLEFGAILTTN